MRSPGVVVGVGVASAVGGAEGIVAPGREPWPVKGSPSIDTISTWTVGAFSATCSTSLAAGGSGQAVFNSSGPRAVCTVAALSAGSDASTRASSCTPGGTASSGGGGVGTVATAAAAGAGAAGTGGAVGGGTVVMVGYPSSRRAIDSTSSAASQLG
jgi:hypothetical protein